jgi:hypothetical protein
VPVRGLVLPFGVVFAVTEKLTVPLPVPLLPEVIVIQPSLLVAVQGQAPFGVVTLTLPVPAAAVRLCVSGATPYVQPEF